MKPEQIHDHDALLSVISIRPFDLSNMSHLTLVIHNISIATNGFKENSEIGLYNIRMKHKRSRSLKDGIFYIPSIHNCIY